MAQPNFEILSEALTNLQHETQQFHGQILQQLQLLQQQIQDGFQRLETRMDASDKNTIARLTNAAVTNVGTRLEPLFTKDNQAVAQFPERLADVATLNSETLTTILSAYDQPTNGNVAAKRKRFKQFIGVVIDLG